MHETLSGEQPQAKTPESVVPADGTPQVGQPTVATPQPPVEPTEPKPPDVEPVEPKEPEPKEPEPVVEERQPQDFLFPGQEHYDEAAVLRRHATELARRNAELAQQVEAFELDGLTDEEKAIEQERRELEGMRQQMEHIRRQQDTVKWRHYYSQFVAEDEAKGMEQMQNPVQMMHHSFVSLKNREAALQAQVTELQAQLDAAKVATAAPEAGPLMTTGGGGQPTQRRITNLSREEREEIYRKRAMGIYDPSTLL